MKKLMISIALMLNLNVNAQWMNKNINNGFSELTTLSILFPILGTSISKISLFIFGL